MTELTHYVKLQTELVKSPKTWLITGVAGFIGSNLLETLLKLNQRVVGLDNFATGYRHNIDQAISDAGLPPNTPNFQFIEGDIRNLEDCHRAMHYLPPISQGKDRDEGKTTPVDYVLHQAALGSVPRSIEDPITTNSTNIDGFLNMLVAARDANVKRFVYAASSSTYGDHPDLPKVEGKIGNPLSPYAVTKLVNELYADVFARTYGFKSIGLRYFNIFGKRQDPNGAYAAVIPKWIAAMINNQPVYINGDGETSRDFCYIKNAVQANLLAATAEHAAKPVIPAQAGIQKQENDFPVIPAQAGIQNEDTDPANQVYNVAVGERTSLNSLFENLRTALKAEFPHLETCQPNYRDFRAGDVRHSLADTSKAAQRLGYAPDYTIGQGIAEATPWYIAQTTKQ